MWRTGRQLQIFLHGSREHGIYRELALRRLRNLHAHVSNHTLRLSAATYPPIRRELSILTFMDGKRAKSSAAKQRNTKQPNFTPTDPENEHQERRKKPKRETSKPKLISSSNRQNPKSELEEAWREHDDLTAKYYKLVDIQAENSVRWFDHRELKGVPATYMTKWKKAPMASPNRSKFGLMRKYAHTGSMAARAVIPHTRERLTEWDENSCADLAPKFKELLKIRAKIARLSGAENFFQLASRGHMLDAGSVQSFLDDLRRDIAPRMNSYMEDMLGKKLQDLNFHKSITEVRNDLEQYGKSVADFQARWKQFQLHWGDVEYYSLLKRRQDMHGGKWDTTHHYFPMHYTVHKLLATFGQLLGMHFEELLPGHEQYEQIVSTYKRSPKSSSKITDQEEKLLVFHVYDTSLQFAPAKYLGVLVLDLLERPGKIQNPRCVHYGLFRTTADGKDHPSLAILIGLDRPKAKRPTLMGHEDLISLAHELGHAIHHFASGDWRSSPNDFLEIPSTFLEHWVCIPEILQRLSSHYTYQDGAYLYAWKSDPEKRGMSQPPKMAPIETFDHITISYHPGFRYSHLLRYLWMSRFDMIAHSYSEQELQRANIGIDCLRILQEDSGIASIGTQVNNSYLHWNLLRGYRTYLYCYLLADVYTVDIFQKFFAKNPLNRKEGIRFRKLVLEHRDYKTPKPSDSFDKWIQYLAKRLMGRPQTTLDALKKYMGRKPNNKAFVKKLNAPMEKHSQIRERRGFWATLVSRFGLHGTRF